MAVLIVLRTSPLHWRKVTNRLRKTVTQLIGQIAKIGIVFDKPKFF